MRQSHPVRAVALGAEPGGTRTRFDALRFSGGNRHHHRNLRDGLDRRATEWTGGVRVKPHVDTIDMETMGAFGESTPLFVLLEFGQTDGAIDWIGMRFGGESEDRERVENGGVEAAALGEDGSGGGIFRFEIEDKAIPTAAGLEAAAAGSENVPAGVEVKADDENDDEQKDDDCAEHNFSAEGEIIEAGRRSGVADGDGVHYDRAAVEDLEMLLFLRMENLERILGFRDLRRKQKENSWRFLFRFSTLTLRRQC